MGYIVNLTVILGAIFSTTSGDISPKDVLGAIDNHVNSGIKNKIHDDIRSFVPEAVRLRVSVPQKDLILDRIIDLIQRFCVPPTGNSRRPQPQAWGGAKGGDSRVQGSSRRA